MDRRKLKKRWLWQGGVGASLFGFGLCAVVESGFLKHSDAPSWKWISLGTLSLCVVLLGLVLLIKAGFLGEQLKNRKARNE
ncbi:hypothetical protein FK220_011695 [Flavobacteriaceae bacterium TP-CH-4]|uniref:Uncharacterized protein n=1 Tax=Pelagihabitans pacificus TaxID=2696054 RepID=A0A967AU19_9FLAO|nr:hypothetical protein [Pelagihabitans pacificus]NHF60009.1 hypothetical protein [Pelagihabitans pacificus]